MSREFDGVNDDIIYGSAFSVTGGSTIACWLKAGTLGGNELEHIVDLGTVNSYGHQIRVHDIGTPRIVQGLRTSTTWWSRSTTAGATVGTEWGNGNWHHLVSTIPASATDMSGVLIYWDGILQAMDSWTGSGGTPIVCTHMQISGRPDGEARQFTGSIAEVGVWEAELTPTEVAILGSGVVPSQVRPQSLHHYVPLVRDVQDKVYGSHISTEGTTISSHPRIIQPSTKVLGLSSKTGKLWVNDAPTKDGGEVLQTYPRSGWTDTSIDVGQVIDTTGLTGQLYLGVENAAGYITWRAITVENFTITAVSGDNIIHDYETNWEITGSSFGVR